MALSKVSPGLLPAENYARFGKAFDAIDAATAAVAGVAQDLGGKQDAFDLASLLRSVSTSTLAIADIRRVADADRSATVAGLATKADQAAVAPLFGQVARQSVEIGACSTRPGEFPEAFTLAASPIGLIGPGLDLPGVPAGLIGTSRDGLSVRMEAPGVLGSRHAFAIETGRVYRIHLAVRRLVDVADPSNDTVRIGYVPLSQTKLLLGTPVVITDLPTLKVSDGRQIISAGIARSAGPNVDFVVPAGVVFIRPFAQNFASTGQTSVEVLGLDDVTDATLLPPVSSDALARLSAIESEGIPARLRAVETHVAGPLVLTFPAIADAAASHIDQGVQTVVTFGTTSAGVARVHWFHRAAAAPAIGFSFTDQDGQIWGETDRSLDPAFMFSSSVQGTGLTGVDGGGWFVYNRVDAPGGPETAGRFQVDSVYVGGSPGFIRKSLWALGSAGPNTTDFVRPLVAELDSYTSAGDNAAAYFVARRHTDGITRAFLAEAIDVTGGGNPIRAMPAGDIIVAANGGDANFQRGGLRITARRPVGSSGDACFAGYGVLVNSAQDIGSVVRKAFWGVGQMEVGLDLASASISEAAIKLASGQRIAMEATGARTMAYEAGVGLVYRVGNNIGLRVDDNAGLFVSGLNLEPTGKRSISYSGGGVGLVYSVDGAIKVRIDDTGALFVPILELEPTGTRSLAYEAGIGLVYRVNGGAAVRVTDSGDVTANGSLILGTTGAVKLTATAQQGNTSAVLAATKPGTTSGQGPATWIRVDINGTTCWVPAWAS